MVRKQFRQNWFAILNSLFKLSSKKLIGPFIETNYQQKLLPLLQRQKKNAQNVDFRDEEIENIVGGDESSDMDKMNLYLGNLNCSFMKC